VSGSIVWFRRDLRLEQQPALAAALNADEPILPIYIHAPEEEAPWAPGAASQSWLHHSLHALDQSLEARRSALKVFRGPSGEVLEKLVRETGATRVLWNRRYEPKVTARDSAIKARLRTLGVDAQSFAGALLHEPMAISTGGGTPYRVFTPYWRSARTQLALATLPSLPKRFPALLPSDGAVSIDSLALKPKLGWDSGFYSADRTPGELGAQSRLRTFIDAALERYQEGRDRPDLGLTSRLSSALHFGEISVHALAKQLLDWAEASGQAGLLKEVEWFLRELGWRDFSWHLLYHFPHISDANLNPEFDRYPWRRGPSTEMTRWQRGQTGIPLVDAGMRELWQTGFMHNRVRMVVASLLTKNLGIHWLEGARWFWDTLTDADLANNTQGWQWSAGSGADAQPFFRIFNPTSQGEKFDPDGSYVRRYVPELERVPLKWLHNPWDAPRSLAPDYPAPIVDLKRSREAALGDYKAMRGR
jgi:deoxyribodipyrimidine photo-lyase